MTDGLGISAGLLLVAVTVRICAVVAGAGGDARQVDRLRRGGVLEDRDGLAIGSSVGGLVDRRDRHVKVCGEGVDAAVGGAAVVGHGDGDRRRAAGVGHRRVGERAGACWGWCR